MSEQTQRLNMLSMLSAMHDCSPRGRLAFAAPLDIDRGYSAADRYTVVQSH